VGSTAVVLKWNSASGVDLRFRRVPLTVKFHIRRTPVAATQLINEPAARQVPESDIQSGNSGDHRIVDQVDGADPVPDVEFHLGPGPVEITVKFRSDEAGYVAGAQRSAHSSS